MMIAIHFILLCIHKFVVVIAFVITCVVDVVVVDFVCTHLLMMVKGGRVACEEKW